MISRAISIGKRASSPVAAHGRDYKAVLDDSSLDAVCGMIDYVQFGFNREERLKRINARPLVLHVNVGPCIVIIWQLRLGIWNGDEYDEKAGAKDADAGGLKNLT